MSDKTKPTITKQQIDAWKKEHKAVFVYKANGKEAYFKNMTLQIMDAARSTAKVDQSAFKIFVIRNTFLGGDKELIEEEKYLMGIFDWLDLLLIKVEGEMLEL